MIIYFHMAIAFSFGTWMSHRCQEKYAEVILFVFRVADPCQKGELSGISHASPGDLLHTSPNN